MAVGQPRYPSPPRIRIRISGYPFHPRRLILFQAHGVNFPDVVGADSVVLQVESPPVPREGQESAFRAPAVGKVTALMRAVTVDHVPVSVRLLDDSLLLLLDIQNLGAETIEVGRVEPEECADDRLVHVRFPTQPDAE